MLVVCSLSLLFSGYGCCFEYGWVGFIVDGVRGWCWGLLGCRGLVYHYRFLFVVFSVSVVIVCFGVWLICCRRLVFLMMVWLFASG